MASKIFVSRQKLHSTPSTLLDLRFSAAISISRVFPAPGKYDRLTRHRKIAARDSQIFPSARSPTFRYKCGQVVSDVEMSARGWLLR